jgi:cysteine synthase
MLTLTLGVRPANPTRASRISGSVAKTLDTARQHLRTGNPGAYARALAGEHRAQTERQQRAIEAAIVSDGTTRLFTRHAGNGCFLAVEG